MPLPSKPAEWKLQVFAVEILQSARRLLGFSCGRRPRVAFLLNRSSVVAYRLGMTPGALGRITPDADACRLARSPPGTAPCRGGGGHTPNGRGAARAPGIAPRDVVAVRRYVAAAPIARRFCPRGPRDRAAGGGATDGPVRVGEPADGSGGTLRLEARRR